MSAPRVSPMFVFAVVSVAMHALALGKALRSPAPAPAPSFQATPAPLSGDTLDVEPPSPALVGDTGFAPSTAAGATGRASLPGPGAQTAAPASGRTTRGGTPSPSVPPSLFGAVGIRTATDLATSFTRAFPQAASADPLWTTATLGPSGVAELAIAIDEAGHIVTTVIGGSPSSALRRGIERTLAVLGERPFTARGAWTRLRIRAHVSIDDVHDGLHGDVFALSGGSFSGDMGTAFFALPSPNGPGRRVDVELKLERAP